MAGRTWEWNCEVILADGIESVEPVVWAADEMDAGDLVSLHANTVLEFFCVFLPPKVAPATPVSNQVGRTSLTCSCHPAPGVAAPLYRAV